MYARVISTKIKPGQFDEMIEQYNAALDEAPAEARQGHRTTYLLVDREKSEALVVGLWDDLQGAEAASASQWNQELAQKMAPFFTEAPVRSVYEVAVAAHSETGSS